MLVFLKSTFFNFLDDRCPRIAGALAYYALIALPALLVCLIMIIGTVFGEKMARTEVTAQISQWVGSQGAEQLQAVLQNVERPSSEKTWSMVLTIGALLFGATGLFGQLQIALNDIWCVMPDPKRGGVRNFIGKRLHSILILVLLGVLLISSIIASMFVQAFSLQIRARLGWSISEGVLQSTNQLISFLVITLFFASLFRFLPDARLRWRDVGVGALTTSLLFLLAKFGLGLYLSHSNPANAYGAAGSVIVVMIWIYASALILMIGAEITKSWIWHRGNTIRPARGAVAIECKPRMLNKPGVPPPEQQS